jgi:arylsulfatase A-like enzyme
LNIPRFSQSKFYMKLIRFFLVAAGCLSLGAVARADLAAELTNALAEVQPVKSVVPRRDCIIFIQCHDLGWGDLSCYGQTNYQTPNLDRLAAEGIRFTDYHARAAAPLSASASLLTGKHSADLAPDTLTLADRFAKLGYHTGLIGEWSLSGKPWQHGFQDFGGFLEDKDGQNYYPDTIWRCDSHHINSTNNQIETRIGQRGLFDAKGNPGHLYLPDLIFSMAANYIRTFKPDRYNHYQPFFLLVNVPAPRNASDKTDNFPVPTDAPYGSEPWPQAAKNRAALINRIDNGMGRVWEELQKQGLTNNVAVFFTSMGGPAHFADTNLMPLIKPNGVASGNTPADPLRAPMIVRWPEKIAPGRVSGLPWTAADFAPTALEMGYVKIPPQLDGVSILPTLIGRPQTNQIKAYHP